MKSKISRIKAFFVAAACGGIPLITEATCDPYGAYFFRDDDFEDYYYDDGFYYEDPFFYDPYCDPFYCY